MSDGPGNYFTTDATLIGGDSGGPLFDLDGKLIGINSSIGWSWKTNNHAGHRRLPRGLGQAPGGRDLGRTPDEPAGKSGNPGARNRHGHAARGTASPSRRSSRNRPPPLPGFGSATSSFPWTASVSRKEPNSSRFLIKHEVGDVVKLGIMRDRAKLGNRGGTRETRGTLQIKMMLWKLFNLHSYHRCCRCRSTVR